MIDQDTLFEQLRNCDQKLADERERFNQALRQADSRLLEVQQEAEKEYKLLVQKYNDAHFLQLNENAKRTIEERSHFVSSEAFDPFRQQILEFINKSLGRQTAAVALIAILFALVSLGLRFL